MESRQKSFNPWAAAEKRTDQAPLYSLDLETLEWSKQRIPGMNQRDDFASFYDASGASLYLFGGFVDGKKSNDLLKLDVQRFTVQVLEQGSK